jgi:hypothetical protein
MICTYKMNRDRREDKQHGGLFAHGQSVLDGCLQLSEVEKRNSLEGVTNTQTQTGEI